MQKVASRFSFQPPVLPLTPLMRALRALIKNAHRLVGAPNLNLHKIRLHPSATATHRANGGRFVHIVPRAGAAEDVVDFLWVAGWDRRLQGRG